MIMLQDYDKIINDYNKILGNKDEELFYSSDELCRIVKSNNLNFESHYDNHEAITTVKREERGELNFCKQALQEDGITNCITGSVTAFTRKNKICKFTYNFETEDAVAVALNAYERKLSFDEIMEERERRLQEQRKIEEERKAEEERRLAEEEQRREQERIRYQEEERARKRNLEEQNRYKRIALFKKVAFICSVIFPPFCILFAIIAWIVLGEYFVYQYAWMIVPFSLALVSSLVAIVFYVKNNESGKYKLNASIAIVLSAVLMLPILILVQTEKPYMHYDGLSGNWLYNELEDGTISISKIRIRSSSKAIVPNKLKGKLVTRIADNAFMECKNLKSVTIPDSVTSIGERAFLGCEKLTSVSLGSGIKSIEYRAFRNCYDLTKIVIPDSVESMGKYIFDGCRNLTIYCEAESQPSGWDADWNRQWSWGPYPVVWGYQG